MKAAVFHGAEKGLKVEDIAVPEPGPGEARVKVAACGVCHTDLHYLDHGVPTFKKPPIVLGHEAAGWIDATGEGVKGFEKGQAVLVPAVLTCGKCRTCRNGRGNICESMMMLGNHIDGGFAEFLSCPAKDIVPLPKGMDPVQASVVADAVTTAYHAVVNRARVRAGDRIAIFGCGGVGLSALQFAVMTGAHVLAVDIDEKKLAIAREFGAAETLQPDKDMKVPKAVKKWAKGGVDIAMECIGNPVTINQAHGSVRLGGRLCIVGYSEKPVEIAAAKIMFFEQEIVGSLGCRPVDFPKVLDLVQSGRFRIEPLITGRIPIAQIDKAFDDLRKGLSLRSVILPGA